MNEVAVRAMAAKLGQTYSIFRGESVCSGGHSGRDSSLEYLIRFSAGDSPLCCPSKIHISKEMHPVVYFLSVPLVGSQYFEDSLTPTVIPPLCFW